MSNRKPVQEIRLGFIKASIWKSKRTNGNHFSVSVCRLYKDGDVWRESSKYARDDLLLLSKVVDQAHTWIYDQSKRNASHTSGASEDLQESAKESTS